MSLTKNTEHKKSHLTKKWHLKIWMGGVSIISGSLSGAQGAFPARQIHLIIAEKAYCCQVFLIYLIYNMLLFLTH